MTTEPPSRTITGLGAPRASGGGVQADVRRLLARNRTATTPPAPAAQPGPVRRAKEQLNVTVPGDVRARIRAAYRYTALAEGHRSFSDLISSLLEAEAARLEGQYNDGRPFTGGGDALPPGRPLGD